MEDDSKSGTHIGPNATSDNVEVDLTNQFSTNDVFHSRDKILNWARSIGKQNGVVVVIGKFQNRCGKYRSHKNNKPENQVKGLRVCGTKKIECTFELRGNSIQGSEDSWGVTVVCGIHNHRLAKCLEGHSYAGRLTTEEMILVSELSKSGLRANQVVSAIKSRYPANASELKTVYNARQKLKVRAMDGRTQIQHLLKLLNENNYVESHRCAEDGETLTELFWAHPTSVRLAQCFPHVFIMDCTYKTNKYNWSFFQIVGVTSTYKSFTACQVLMSAEKEVYYR